MELAETLELAVTKRGANELAMPNDEQYSQSNEVGEEMYEEYIGAETVELANLLDKPTHEQMIAEIKVLSHVTPRTSLSTGGACDRATEAVNVATEPHAVHKTTETP